MFTKTISRILFTSLFLITFSSIAFAQNDFIIGPTELCVGECGTWEYFNSDPNCEHLWDFGDGNTSLGSNIVTHCYTSEGTYIITSYNQCDSTFAELALVVSTGFIPDIVSTSITSCPDNELPSACDKTCANSTVTYTVPLGSGQTLDWSVQGAESYTVDGEFVTVTWGNPGSGYISVISTTTGSGDPLQLNCGANDATFGDANGSAWTIPYGGSAPYTYTWSNGATSQNISNLPAGEYCVTITDGQGNTASCCTTLGDSFCDLPLSSFPTINPTADCQECTGSISLNLTGGSGSYQYLWSDGSTLADLTNLCVGIYSVTIFDNQTDCSMTQSYGIFCPNNTTTTCIGEAELCIDIIADPEALADTDPPLSPAGVVEICEGQTVYLNNLSTNAESYIWTSGNGQTNTNQDVAFTYDAGGTYEIMLIAKNECLCSDTTYLTVEVENAQGPAILCTGTVCTGEEVTYTTDAMGCANYYWTVGAEGTVTAGGTITDDYVTVVWTNGWAGSIELSVDGCGAAFCQQATIEEIPIISDDAEIEGPSIVCRGDVEVYTIQKWNGTEYNWTVSTYGEIKSGQNTNEVIVKWDVGFIPPDQQWVAVDYENCYLDCSGSDTHNVDILPEYYLIGPIEACQNSTTQYQAKNVITNAAVLCNWTMTAEDGTVLWTSAGAQATANITWPATPGVYRIDATPDVPADFCYDLYTVFVKTVEGPPAPTGITGQNLVCPGQAYNYDVVSTQPTNGFEWTINDGGIISNQSGSSINVTWGMNPPYELSVVEISAQGLPCVSDPTFFTATPITTLSLNGVSELCVEESAIYTATYYEDVRYVWEIIPSAAGTVITGQETDVAEILWHTDIAATVQVTMCGLVETFPVNVHGDPEPVVNHPVGICEGTTTMVSTSTAYTSYTWRDENGMTLSASPTPNLGPGNYEVIVIDNFGCEGNSTFYIDSYEAPEVSISSPGNTAFCPGDPIPTIYALNTEDGYTYQWYVDNSPIPATTVSVPGDQFGTYHLVVTNTNGCTVQSNILEIVEYCGPVGDGTCTGGNCGAGLCPEGSVTWDITPSDICNEGIYDNNTLNYVPGSVVWNFDDPASGADNYAYNDKPKHTFTHAGFFVVQLDLVLLNGNACHLAQIDTVPVAANFDQINACEGDATQFLDLSTFLPEPYALITDYYWHFGDPASGPDSISADQEPTHVFNTAGFYDVTLVVTNQSGCTSTMVKTVEVYEKPTGSFAQPVLNCEGTALEFNAILSPDVINMHWDFGDPASGAANEATNPNTFHAFDAPGNYTVTLTTTNVYGCEDVFTDIVVIDPNPLTGPIDFTNPICEGVTTTLTAPPGATAWVWSTGELTESIDVSEAGVYYVTLTDNMGCSYVPDPAALDIIPAPDASIMAIEFNEFGQPVSNFFDGYITCEGEDVYLQMLGSGTYSYEWSTGVFGDQLPFDETHNNQLSVGDHDFTVTVTDNLTGCTSVVGPFTVTINPIPVDVMITAAPFPVCENEMTTMSVLSPNPDYTYFWSNGEVGTSISTSIAGEYFVTAITPFGCQAESNRLEILKVPDISKVPDGCHERCSPDTICLPPIPGVVAYQWYLDNMLIPAPEGTIANYVATESGNYQVVLTDANGCTSISSGLDLNILPLDTATLLLEACTGELVEYEGDMLAPGSTTDYVFSNQFGCDSTITVTVLERLVYDFPIVLEGCEGSTVTFQGVEYLAGTNTQLMYTTQYGCDSIYDITVDVLPVDTTYIMLSACEGSTIDYEGAELAPGDSYWINLTSSLDCDSVISVSVDAYPDFSFDVESPAEAICWNDPSGTVIVSNITGGATPFIYSLDGINYQASDTITGLSPGDYTVYVQDDNGCEQEDDLSISAIQPIEVAMPDPILPCDADSIILQPFVLSNFADSISWVWQDGSVEHSYAVYDPGMYSLQLSNQCETITQLFDVELTPDGRESFIFVPNAFSPNYDGYNDIFQALTSSEVIVLEWEMYVFDRWGATLYHSTDFNDGWDGVFKSEDLNPGVYVWWYKAKVRTCHRELELADKGDVTILK